MAEAATKLPVKNEKTGTPAETSNEWEPLENLRREMDRAFDVFRRGFWRSPVGLTVLEVEPFLSSDVKWVVNPAVDIVDKSDKYEVRVELPGMDAKDIDLQFADGALTIKGKKEEQKEEKKENYHLSERRYGSFQRSFAVPQGVDPDKIDANFKNGVLTIAVPKVPDAKKNEKKIAIATS